MMMGRLVNGELYVYHRWRHLGNILFATTIFPDWRVPKVMLQRAVRIVPAVIFLN